MKALVRWGRILHDYLTDISYVLAATAITLMGAVYCMEVVLRYFFNSPTRWSTETVANLMLVMLFLSLPHATRSLNHIAVTLVVDLFPRQAAIVDRVINFIGMVLCGLVAYVSFGENVRQYTSMIETSGNIPIPKWWMSVWITYGFGSMAIWYLRMMFEPGPIPPRLRFISSTTGQGGDV
jgi:C4-dicarboxylate transporter DctQ subunit